MKDLKLIALINYSHHLHEDFPYQDIIFIADLLHLSFYGRAITDHGYFFDSYNDKLGLWAYNATQSNLISRDIVIDDEFYLVNELLNESEKECLSKSVGLLIEHENVHNVLKVNKWDAICSEVEKGNKIPFKLICEVVGGQELIKYIENHTLEGDPWND